MRSPGLSSHPEHKLETKRMNEKVEVYIDNEKVAETRDAIKLFETDYDPVIYIPKNDLKNIDLINYLLIDYY